MSFSQHASDEPLVKLFLQAIVSMVILRWLVLSNKQSKDIKSTDRKTSNPHIWQSETRDYCLYPGMQANSHESCKKSIVPPDKK